MLPRTSNIGRKTTMSTQSARITGPITYKSPGGQAENIPLGPCLVERLDDRLIDIIWGADGQRSAALPLEDVESAEQHGNLILLD